MPKTATKAPAKRKAPAKHKAPASTTMPAKKKLKASSKATTITQAAKSASKSTNAPTPAKITSSFPTKVTKTLTVSQLREEAECRGLDLGNLQLKKNALLEMLGEGSLSLRCKELKGGLTPTKKLAATKKATIVKKVTTVKKDPVNNEKEDTKPPSAKAISTKNPPAKGKLTDAAAPKKKVVVVPSKINNKMATAKAKPTKKDPLAKSVGSTKNGVKLAKTTLTVVKTSNKPKVKTSPQAKSVVQTKLTPTKATKTASKASSSTKSVPSQQGIKQTPVLSRISKKSTLVQLKAEASARGIPVQGLPKTKAALLHHLIEGSIHVAMTDQYRQYQQVLEQLTQEKPDLYQRSLDNFNSEEEKRAQQNRQRLETKQALPSSRDREMQLQQELHVHSHPQLHPHPLAKTQELQMNGLSRSPQCDICRSHHSGHSHVRDGDYTCELCDWDICSSCVMYKNHALQEREQDRNLEAVKSDSCYASSARTQTVKKENNRARNGNPNFKREEPVTTWTTWTIDSFPMYDGGNASVDSEDGNSHDDKWNAAKQFEPIIIEPSAVHKRIVENGDNAYKFTVWCSDGDNYSPPPDQYFDSRWKTGPEAIDRARYLFFWKNPWGIEPEGVFDEGEDPYARKHKGLKTYTCTPDDSSTWTVGVVPSVGFQYLSDSVMQRHNFDETKEEAAARSRSYGMCY